MYELLFIMSISLVWTCGSSTQEIILPRLKYIGEFLFTSPKQSKMNPLCLLGGARIRTTLAKWFPVIFCPCTESDGQICLWVCFSQPSPVHGLDNGFVIYIFYSSMAQTNVPQIKSRLKLQTCVPWCLFFLLRQTHGRYILASKEFIRPCFFASRGSFWMNAQKMKDSHTIMYILENTSHIYIYI